MFIPGGPQRPEYSYMAATFAHDYNRLVGATTDLHDIRNFVNDIRICFIVLTTGLAMGIFAYLCKSFIDFKKQEQRQKRMEQPLRTASLTLQQNSITRRKYSDRDKIEYAVNQELLDRQSEKAQQYDQEIALTNRKFSDRYNNRPPLLTKLSTVDEGKDGGENESENGRSQNSSDNGVNFPAPPESFSNEDSSNHTPRNSPTRTVHKTNISPDAAIDKKMVTDSPVDDPLTIRRFSLDDKQIDI